ncbi:MAG: anti-sigma factor family protein [Myxococcota bacterium]
MTCTELEQFLYPYLDGELDAAECVEIETHLAGCAECATRVHSEKRFMEGLRAKTRGLANVPPAPEALWAKVRGGLAREQRGAASQRWFQLTAAAAAVVVVSGGSYVYLQESSRQKLMADAAARHAKRFPLEIHQRSGQQIEAWFAGKFPHRVAVPAFPNAVPAGARLLNVQERQAAYISYDADTPAGAAPGRIGLFVYDDRGGANATLSDAEVAKSLGYNVVSWRDGEVGYTLVTDLDEADIRRMLFQPAPSGARPSLPLQPASLQR